MQAILEAATTQEKVESGQCDLIQEFDSIKEAKLRAKYVLTENFAQNNEMKEKFGYARIMVDGECRADYLNN